MKTIFHTTRPASIYLIKFFIFIILSLALSAIVLLSPISRPTIIINMSAELSGTSRMFFSEHGSDFAKKSLSIDVKPGRNVIKFPLRGLKPMVRWEPVAQGKKIEVQKIYFTIFRMKLKSVNVTLSPAVDGISMKENGAGFLISINNEVKNPQINIDFNKSQVYHKRIALSCIAGILIAVMAFFLLSKRKFFYNAFNKADFSLTAFAGQLRDDGFNLREFSILVIMGTVLYSYFLTNFLLLVDNEFAAVRQDPSAWVSQGRWFTYLVEKFLLQRPAVPFAPYVILIIAFAFSYMALLRAHGYKESWRTYLTFPIFCAFPSWWAITVFYANTPALAIGLLFISFSAYLCFGEGFTGKLVIHPSYPRHSLVLIMLACAIAAYQSLILLFVCFSCGILLVRCFHNGKLERIPVKTVATALVKVAILIILATLLYVVINKLAQKFIAPDNGYIDRSFMHYDVTFKYPLAVLKAIFYEQLAIYGGSAERYGAKLVMNGIVICLASLVVLRVKWYNIPTNVLLWLGLLATPFAFHLVAGGEPLAMRTLIPLAYVSWLSCMFILSARRHITILVSIILVGLLQIKIFGVTSQYIASTTIVQSHDRLLAADIYSRIGKLSADFDPKAPLKMDFYGDKGFKTNFYANAWQGTMQGSVFSWGPDNLYRITSMMRAMGYPNIVLPSAQERKALTPEYEKMPLWPADGSIKKVGDIYLIKLSNGLEEKKFRQTLYP